MRITDLVLAVASEKPQQFFQLQLAANTQVQ
jgi:hypothetical protein